MKLTVNRQNTFDVLRRKICVIVLLHCFSQSFSQEQITDQQFSQKQTTNHLEQRVVTDCLSSFQVISQPSFGIVADFNRTIIDNKSEFVFGKQSNTLSNEVTGGKTKAEQANASVDILSNYKEITSNCTGIKPDFSFKRSSCSPRSFQFIAQTDGSISYKWKINEAQTSIGKNPTILFDDYGSYTVKLIVEGADNCLDSITKLIPVFLASSDIIANPDTAICRGDSIVLTTKTTSLDFCWQSVAGLVNSNTRNPIVKPTQTTTYYFTSQTESINLVKNGDFSQGNKDFISDYTLSSSGLPAGVYTVSSNIQAWHPQMTPCQDHTTGNGNMMLVNGADEENVNVWSQTISVSPNTNYAFSTWIQTITTINPAKVQFSINGVQLGDILTANTASCQWDKFYTIWNSGSSTSATISIVNMNQEFSGNDFAIDDISFTKLEMLYDSITISVGEPIQIKTIKDTIVCEQSPIVLTTTGASHYSWQPSSGLSNPNAANPVALPSATTKYIVTGYNDLGCADSDTVEIKLIAKPVFNILPDVSQGCAGQTFTITASGSEGYRWFSKDGKLISESSSISQALNVSDTFLVAVNSVVCNIQDTLERVVKVSPKPVISLVKSNDIDCDHSTAQLIATGGNVFEWMNNDFINNRNVNNPVVNPEKDTWFKVLVSNDNICQSTDSILVKTSFNNTKNKFYVPNAFTPNSDGLNDCFGLKNWSGVKEFKLEIFNRWGEKIFYSNSPDKCWDGKLRGQLQPNGVFVYLLKAKTSCGNIDTIGTVTLIR